MTPEEKQQLERQLLFTPCKTKEELGDWIDHMLGYRLPDCIVDVDSNSSPLDLVWEIYHEALYVNSPNFEKILAYANRFGAKCCEKGTLLLTKDSGLKKIEDIRVGEVIWSGWNWRKVTDWIHDGIKPGIRMNLENGATITGSKIHRVWACKKGEISPDWIKISELSIEDLVKFSPYDDVDNGRDQWVKVASLSLVNEVDFYDLTVEEDHSYWSNGVVSHNTLGASALELLMVFHDQRDVVHLAAIEEQSTDCLNYVKKALRNPVMAPFDVQGDKRAITIQVFKKDGKYYSPKEYEKIPDVEKFGFQEYYNKIEVIVATPKSLNGKHGAFFCVDGETPILTTSGNVLAKSLYEELEEIDVLTENPFSSKSQFHLEPKRILKKHKRTSDTVEIITKNGRFLVCSADHPVHVDGTGFVAAYGLRVGDKLTCITSTYTKEIDEIFQISPAGERTVYDFTVEENHNFFSGQILSHNCMDETDLLDNESIIQEADGVPTPTKDRRAKHPIVYMTSTRKKAAGRVQKLIDRAEQEDIRVRHWNLIDITKPCPPEKHQPNEPKVSMYVDDNALKAISEESYEQLNEGDRLKYQKHEMFQGCKSCPLAATCKSRLATHQKSSNSTLLLDHAFTTKKVTKGNIEFIKSQFLCRKPLSTGSVFSRFSREKHLLSAAEIYEKLEQQQAPANFNKQSLVKYLKAHPLAKFYGGIDFGYTHMFVAIVAAKVGLHWFILDCLMATELETMECVDLCKRSFYHYGAEWYPDPENPQLISTFKKHGFNCIDFSKKKGTVLAGIEAIRAKLNPGPDAEPQMFFLKGDPSIDGEEESLVEAMEKWSWKLSPTGEPTDIPAEKHKDQVDALRYMVYNITPVRSTNGNRGGRPTNEEVASRPKTLSEQFWDTMKSEGEPLFGLDLSERPDPYDTDPSSAKTTPKIRKRFF